MTGPERLGDILGRVLAGLIPEAEREKIRESYAQRFGRCRSCDRPLGGPSPEQICEDCHAGEALGAAFGAPGGEA